MGFFGKKDAQDIIEEGEDLDDMPSQEAKEIVLVPNQFDVTIETTDKKLLNSLCNCIFMFSGVNLVKRRVSSNLGSVWLSESTILFISFKIFGKCTSILLRPRLSKASII